MASDRLFEYPNLAQYYSRSGIRNEYGNYKNDSDADMKRTGKTILVIIQEYGIDR